MIQVKNSTIHYINERALTFSENDLNDPQRVAVSLVSGTVVMAYVPGTIDYAADGNYERWTLKGYSTKLINDAAHYIYARLSRTDRTALIVFSVKDYNIDGSITTVTGKDENGIDITETTDPSADYFYIKIGELTATDKVSPRELTYDSGLLSTKKGDSMTESSNMWELIPGVDPLINALHKLKDFTVKGFITLVGGLKFSKGKEGDEKVIADVKRSVDSDNEYLLDGDGSIKVDELGNPIPDPDYVPVSDDTLLTTKYLHGKLEGFDDKYLRKDQDDRTPHSLSVGGKTTAEEGIQIGSEFASGLMGHGANIDEQGQAELHSLFVRTFLEVPELRYNRITVRMGDEINSVSAGIIERVEPAADGSGTGTLWLKLEDGEFGSLEPDDLVMQIFSDMQNPGNNADDNSDDGKGNRTIKGFATVYFEVVSVSGDRNEKIEYKLRADAEQIHPYAMGPFSQRGNLSNPERQTIIYQGIYPKPYTRYMTGVNQWEFTFAMIGMQLGDLSNMSAFGQNLSGYSAYLNNVYYTGFIFELTPQQKAEISAYSVSLSEYVGSVRVDSEGNVIAGEYTPVNVVAGNENVVSGNENVVTGEYLLQTRVQAFKGETELAYTSGIPESGQFTCSISSNGCTAGVSNGVISITSVENFEYCYVKVETLCEGKVTFYSTYQVKVIKDGTSALYADIDNEMDSVACDENGKVLFGLPVSCNVSAWYGQRELDITAIVLSLPEGVTASAVQDGEGEYTGKVEVTGISDTASDTLQIGIDVYVELFGKTESRSLTFTVNKVKQGESAVLYKLLPSVDSVKVNDAGEPDVEVVSCRVLKVNALGAEELSSLEGTGLTMQHRIDKGDFVDYTYGESLDITEDMQSVSFRLYLDGALMDAETVPVVKDGNAIKQVGEFYLATSYGYGEGVTREDGPWGTWVEGNIPELSEEKRYLWNYEVISYTGTEPTYTEPAIIAMWTKDGKGVKDVNEWYQVNNDKDNTPAYPHIEGDAWVRDTAPVMREDAKYLWNYEEILWTDDSVTYTEPAMIGAKGETGATTSVLSVSHGAVLRNSLGSFDPATVIVSVRRGMDEEELWISAFGIRVNEDGTEDAFYLGSSEAAVSKWNVELKRWSVTIDKNNISSVVFRAYLDFSNDYNAPGIAQHGITFVQQGEVGEAGPMPRNRGKYDGSTEYFYNDEYRDYVWNSNGFVWIRQGRGLTEGTQTEGAIKGIQPSTAGDTEYWAVADRMSLTAIDTALIDEANIAGFMYKDGMMVSQERDENVTKENPLGSKIVINGNTGYLKCEDADVTGIITAGVMSYKILYGTGGEYDLTGYGMGVGSGTYTLPSASDFEALEIRMLCVNFARSFLTFKIKTTDGTPIYVRQKNDYMAEVFEAPLGYNTIYTLSLVYDDWQQKMAWMISEGIGGSTSGDLSLFVDEALDEDSKNPVQNKVITSELKKYVTLEEDEEITGKKNFTGGLHVNGAPIVYNPSGGYWKLDGDLLVTGGVTMHGSDLGFEPSTVMDAIRTDGETIRVNPTTKELEVIGGSGGGVDQGALEDYLESNKYLTQTMGDEAYLKKEDYTADNVLEKLKTVDGAGSGLDADMLDGFDSNSFPLLNGVLNTSDSVDEALRAGYYKVVSPSNLPSGAYPYGMLEVIEIHSSVTDSEERTAQVYYPHTSGSEYGYCGLAVRVRNNGSWSGWRKFTTSAGLEATYLKLTGGTLTGELVSRSITPSESGTYSLGSSSKFWKEVHAGILNAISATVGGIDMYKSQDGVLYIDGNLVVKGGVTQYGDTSVTASTIMDAIRVDDNTISKANGYLEVIGGTGGGLDEDALENYLTGNKYLTQATGDARYVTVLGTSGNYLTWTKNGATNNITVPFATKATQDGEGDTISTTYLKLSGGTLSGNVTVNGGSASSVFTIRRSPSVIAFQNSGGTSLGYLGFSGTNTPCMYTTSSIAYTLLHSNNYNSYAPKLDGTGASGTWDISISGNASTATTATTATTASKLSAVSKTIWGQTYWTSGGVPTNVSGDMTNVGNIQCDTGWKYKIGTNSMPFVALYSNIVSGGNGSEIQFELNGTAIAQIRSASFRPYSSVSYSLGDSSHLWNGIYLGYNNSSVYNSNGIMFGNGYGRIGCNSDGSIGVLSKHAIFLRTNNPTSGSLSTIGVTIDVSGNLKTTGGITMYSDIRKKTKLNDVELTLKQVADAPLIEHYYNSDEKKTTHVGTIAQYWAEDIGNEWFCKKDEEGFYTMEIQNAALASAISVARELSRFEDRIERRIRQLEEENRELREEIEKLKNA